MKTLFSKGISASCLQHLHFTLLKFHKRSCSTGTWKPVIGLEIHAQISAKSKLFSASGTHFAYPVNEQVSLFDASIPGTLPVLNKRCVEAGVLTALALNSNVNRISRFDRKHYFYSDLPTGYQITQQSHPIATGGYLDYVVFSDDSKRTETKRAKLAQIQLEQDSGKSLHDPESSVSLIDLNRAGMGLMEIVTEPDFHDAEDAATFVKELQLILKTLGTCSGNMYEGALRVDASVSIHKPGEPLGTRSEVKNISSIRFVAKAIKYEIKRQIKILEAGGEIENETRNFDFETGTTVSLRDKEKLHDYRFLPEPNLPPLRIYDSEHPPPTGTPADQVVCINSVRAGMPALPAERRTALQQQYGVTAVQSVIITKTDGYEDLIAHIHERGKVKSARLIANYMIIDLLGELNKRNVNITNSQLTGKHIADILHLVESELISKSAGMQLTSMYLDGEAGDASVQELVDKHNLYQIRDIELFKSLARDLMDKYPKQKRRCLRGKERYKKFFIKAILNETNNLGHAGMTEKALEEVIKEKLQS